MVDQVVDSNVWIASFLEKDRWYQRAYQFRSELEARQHICHLPSLVLIETCGVIARVATLPEALRARQNFVEWEEAGLIHWYELDSSRVARAVDTSVQLRLKGADAVIVALAQELDLPLKTFDVEIQQRYPNTAP